LDGLGRDAQLLRDHAVALSSGQSFAHVVSTNLYDGQLLTQPLRAPQVPEHRQLVIAKLHLEPVQRLNWLGSGHYDGLRIFWTQLSSEFSDQFLADFCSFLVNLIRLVMPDFGGEQGSASLQKG
jgi:hypothetical protein